MKKNIKSANDNFVPFGPFDKPYKDLETGKHQGKMWRGVPEVEMIWHGEWSDPELEYNGVRANYWQIEDTMYEMAKEDGIDTENDEEFNKYCQEHSYDVYELFDSYIDSSRKNKKTVKSSHKPIKSMYVTEDISGNDLYTRLWSGGKDQFDSMIEDGADADDILNVCEELLFREEGNPPTMTEVNDLIWFEPDTIREYIGLSNPIESGCHGKSKKGKGKKKTVKSAMQISEIHNNTSNLYARIVYCDLKSDVPEFNEEELIPINDFKEQCKGYAESTNGWFTVSHDNSYEPGEYIVTFTNQEGENNEFESDPYFENDLGYVKFELICDAGEELCNYLEDDRMM